MQLSQGHPNPSPKEAVRPRDMGSSERTSSQETLDELKVKRAGRKGQWTVNKRGKPSKAWWSHKRRVSDARTIGSVITIWGSTTERPGAQKFQHERNWIKCVAGNRILKGDFDSGCSSLAAGMGSSSTPNQWDDGLLCKKAGIHQIPPNPCLSGREYPRCFDLNCNFSLFSF